MGAEKELDEVEVTPEMLEAGVDVVWLKTNGCTVPMSFSAEDLAASVFRAMAQASRRCPNPHGDET